MPIIRQLVYPHKLQTCITQLQRLTTCISSTALPHFTHTARLPHRIYRNLTEAEVTWLNAASFNLQRYKQKVVVKISLLT